MRVSSPRGASLLLSAGQSVSVVGMQAARAHRATELICSAKALDRLCCVPALTTPYLVAQGNTAVHQGKHCWVEAHRFWGQSSPKIGWQEVKLALSTQPQLFSTMEFHNAAGSSRDLSVDQVSTEY